MHIVLGTCHHDCPDSCGWQVTVNDEGVTRIGNDNLLDIEGGIRGGPRSVGREQLGHVRLGGALLATVVLGGRLVADEIGGAEYHRNYRNCNCGGFNCYTNCNCDCNCNCNC